jgi:predicted component of type VI protein secretion system
MVNIQILLRARRRYDHLLPDYGLSAPHGKLADDNQIEVLQTQFPETLKRYEPRFNLGVLDFDVNDDGISFMTATGDLRVCPGTLRFSFTVNSRIILSVHFASSGA